MDLPIAALLTQDGITNGAIYALLALALVLVFAVTRVIFGAVGRVRRLRHADARRAAARQAARHRRACSSAWRCSRASWRSTRCVRATRAAAACRAQLALWTGVPLALAALVVVAGAAELPLCAQVCSTLAARHRARTAALPDRLPAARRSERARAADRFGRRALRAAPGSDCGSSAPKGSRTPAFTCGVVHASVGVNVSLQSLLVVVTSLALIVALYCFFGRTLYGKALRATALNRVGARLVGIVAEPRRAR